MLASNQLLCKTKRMKVERVMKDLTDYSNVSFAVVLLSPDDMVYQKDKPHPGRPCAAAGT